MRGKGMEREAEEEKEGQEKREKGEGREKGRKDRKITGGGGGGLCATRIDSGILLPYQLLWN